MLYADFFPQQVSDPYVLRILINQARIEQQILANTRKEAQQALMSLGRGGTAWSADGFSVRVFKWVSLLFCHSLGGGFSLGVVFSLRVCEVHFLSFGVFLSFLLRVCKVY